MKIKKYYAWHCKFCNKNYMRPKKPPKHYFHICDSLDCLKIWMHKRKQNNTTNAHCYR